MSLDVYLVSNVYDANITHNLGEMAKAAGIYQHLWRPDEIGVYCARELIQPLSAGLAKLLNDPEHFKKYDSPNGWGTYENFVPFVSNYLAACVAYPDSRVEVSR